MLGFFAIQLFVTFITEVTNILQMANVSGSRGLNFSGQFDVSEILANQQKVIQGFNEVRNAANQSGTVDTSRNLREAQLATQQALRESRLEFQRLQNEIRSLSTAYSQGRVDEQNYRTEAARLRAEQQALRLATQQARTTQAAANGSYREAQQRLTQLGNQIRNVEGGFNNLGRVQQARIAEYRRLNDQLREFDRQLGNNQRNVGNYASGLNGVSSRLVGLAAGFAAASLSIDKAFRSAVRQDSLRTSLGFIFKDADLADRKLAELRETANRLGLEYVSLAETYRSFAGAAIASNFSLTQAERVFNSVTNAGAKLKLSSDQVAGALLAIQQMISKGNVQAEELRGQLGERLPGAFAIAARAIGVTEQELNKMLQKGEVLAVDLLPKLATELDKTFGNDATKQIDSLQASLNRLNNTFSEAVEKGALGKFFKFIVDGANNAITGVEQLYKGIRRLAYDKAINEGVDNGFLAKTSAIFSAVTFSGSASGIASKFINQQDVENEKIARARVRQEEKLNELKKIGARIGKDIIIDNKITGETIASLTREEAKLNDLRKQRADLDKKGITGSSLSNVNSAIVKQKALVDELRAAYELPAVKPKTKAELAAEAREERKQETALERQRKLQAEIDVLTNKGRAKRLSADEQELADIDAKYKKIREKAIAFNNSTQNKGLRVDTGGLLFAQSTEETAARDKQGADRLKKSLDEQAKVYEAYEKYVSDFGKQQADERFKSQIGAVTNYIDYLRSKRRELTGEDENGRLGVINDTNRNQVAEIDKQIKLAVDAEQKRTDALLKEFMSYADRRKLLTEQYERDLIDIQSRGGDVEARTRRYNEEIKQLDDANATKLASYEKLFVGIEKLSVRNALRTVQQARNLLAEEIKKGVLTPEEINQINELLNRTEVDIRGKSGQSLIELGSAISNAASAVGELDDEFGKVLGTVGNIVGQLGNIKKGFADFKLAQGNNDVFGQLSAGLGVFGAGLSLFQGVFSLFDRSRQREEQAAYARDLQNKQTEALNKALERQIALLDQVYGTERITNYDFAIKQATQNADKYQQQLQGRFQLTGNKFIDDLITQINSGKRTGFGVNQGFVNNILEGRTAAIGLTSDLTELQRLLDEGKLDEGTAKIVENLIKASEAAQDLQNRLNAELTGTTLDSIADNFISTLTDGTQDFGKTFEETIQKSIINGFRGEIIRNQLQAFYTQFAELSKGGLTEAEIEALRKTYINASEKAKADLEALSKATGIDLTKDASGSSASSSTGIARAQLTEETGQRIDGIMRAQYEISKSTNALLLPVPKYMAAMNAILTDNFNQLVAVNANTRRTADNTDLLNTKLDAIIQNTDRSNVPSGYGSGVTI